MSALVGLIVVSGALLGSLGGVAVFHEASGTLVVRLFEIAVNLWLLSVLVQTVALLAAVYGPRGARPGLWSAFALLSLYVLHFLTPLWDVVRFSTPFNVFTYYQPHKLMFGERSFGENVLVLGLASAVGLAIAARRFHARDIPG
jgi:ABC-type transport system involved in multi-copper enzyme maturation permease subunit